MVRPGLTQGSYKQGRMGDRPGFCAAVVKGGISWGRALARSQRSYQGIQTASGTHM